jgi:hypothetical protein
MPEPENNGPENQPPQPAGKPYSVRRVNNVPWWGINFLG